MPGHFIQSGAGSVITVFAELPDWRFSAKKTPDGPYEVLGIDRRTGRRLTARDDDPMAAVDCCRELATRLSEMHKADAPWGEDPQAEGGDGPREGGEDPCLGCR